MSYEAAMEELRLRALSCYANVARDSIWTSEAWDSLSTRGNLKPYELKLFPPTHFGETERIATFEKVMNKFWVPYDLSGSDQSTQGRGYGGVDEIVSLIEAEARKRGCGPCIVTVDYAQLLARRYIIHNHNSNFDGMMRHVMGTIIPELSARIAKRFKTTVWVLAQFNKSGNKTSPGTLPSHIDTAEASNFAENADFAFTIGNKQEGNYCLIGATKTRRAEMRQAIPVWIDGQLNVVRNCSHEMRVDPASRRIVKKGEMSKVIKASDGHDQAGDEVHFLGN